MNNKVKTGWKCPTCGGGCAPWITYCRPCEKRNKHKDEKQVADELWPGTWTVRPYIAPPYPILTTTITSDKSLGDYTRWFQKQKLSFTDQAKELIRHSIPSIF